MKIAASIGKGAKKTDHLGTRVGKLTLTAELSHLPFDEHRWLARLFRLIQQDGVEGVVVAAEKEPDS